MLADRRMPSAATELAPDGITRPSTLRQTRLAWTRFAAAAPADFRRFCFPTWLFEPPTRRKPGTPNSYALGLGEVVWHLNRAQRRPGRDRRWLAFLYERSVESEGVR